MSEPSEGQLTELIHRLRAEPREATWFEFKRNVSKPDEIGRYISALSNAARLADRDEGYLVWGIDDTTHEIVGTSFDWEGQKVGNAPLLMALRNKIKPGIGLTPLDLTVDGKRLMVLGIAAAEQTPTEYQNIRYIRIDSGADAHVQKLTENQHLERRLWKLLSRTSVEQQDALADVDDQAVLNLLDDQAFFELLGTVRPKEPHRVIDRFAQERLIREQADGRWSVTNLGALSIGRRLDRFDELGRKAVRIAVYRGTSKQNLQVQLPGSRGYATGLTGLMDRLTDLITSEELIHESKREKITRFPVVALRELVANALIHQDLSVGGAGPTIEVFSDRIEITNPGVPLIPADRFLDAPPRSRNDRLAALFRRFGLCEEMGSGFDRALGAIEEAQLPAPRVTTPQSQSTRVTVYAYRPYE